MKIEGSHKRQETRKIFNVGKKQVTDVIKEKMQFTIINFKKPFKLDERRNKRNQKTR